MKNFSFLAIIGFTCALVSCSTTEKIDVSQSNKEAKELCTKFTKNPQKIKLTKLIKHEPPQYPRKAAFSGVEGCVIAKFDIAENGSPENIEITESVPKGYGFEQATKVSIMRSKYEKKAFSGRETFTHFSLDQ